VPDWTASLAELLDIELPLKVVATWLVVDWISGVVHWCEDSYGRPSAPYIGRRITKPNLRHHFRPRAFVSNSWYSSSELLLCSCAAAVIVAGLLGRLSPMVVLGAALGANANQVHKWSHRTGTENGLLISLAQRLWLVQSPSHHMRHHAGGKDSHYCVLTSFLNPILDGCRFWRGLEWLLGLVGLERRDDEAMLASVLLEEPDFLDSDSSAMPAGQNAIAQR
jgi:plasmanylethanolamine desaturase